MPLPRNFRYLKNIMVSLNQTQVLGADVEFFEQKFRVPLRLSTGLIETITEARATVRVRVGDREATGRGNIYLSDLWAWPDPSRSHAERDAVLRKECEEIAATLPTLVGPAAHPLELGLRLHDAVCEKHDAAPPVLALALCMAPFDAAIHDAAGRALEKSAFDFYQLPTAIPSADYLFSEGACTAIARMLRTPKNALEAWWLVNAHDDLEGAASDFVRAIRENGMRHFKIKILGKDTAEDAARTAAVFQAAKKQGITSPRLSLDSNEAHVDADAVYDFLQKLQRADAEAFDAVMYLEQPTSRNIRERGFDWRTAAALKPILLDEGLSGFDLLPLTIEQGWSGLALKTCKGHSFTLAAAAWAYEQGLTLAMQDLTNPGFSAIHSWLMAAHLPVINGVELNSPQFTPQANAPWLPRLSGLFEVRDGLHRMNPHVVGLGSDL